MNIFITGVNGFMGIHLATYLLKKGHTVLGTSRTQNDYISHPNYHSYSENILSISNTLLEKLQTLNIELIYHLAAISAPDFCEENKEEAFLNNVIGTQKIVKLANLLNCKLIFLSTDLVFNSSSQKANENSIPNPINYYGQTKIEAEKHILQNAHRFEIVRTSLVWGFRKKNDTRKTFLSWIINSLETNTEIQVVQDQFKNITFIDDLIFCLAAFLTLENKNEIWHITGPESISPFDFANKIVKALAISNHSIKPISTLALKEKAKRPLNVIMDNSKITQTLNYNWRCIDSILEDIKIKNGFINA